MRRIGGQCRLKCIGCAVPLLVGFVNLGQPIVGLHRHPPGFQQFIKKPFGLAMFIEPQTGLSESQARIVGGRCVAKSINCLGETSLGARGIVFSQ